MKVLAFDEIPAPDWDALCDASADAWLFHRHDWIGFESDYGACDNLSFGLVHRDRLVAVAPLYRSSLGLGTFVETLVHDGYHRHTGLALAPDLAEEERELASAEWMRTLRDAGERHDADRIHLARQNLSAAALGPEREEIPSWVREHGFQLGTSFGPGGLAPAPGLATTVADQIVPLAQSEETLLARLKKGCRRDVRKAMRAGAESVDRTQDPACVDDYYRLAQLSAERTGESLPPIDQYRAVHDRFAAAGRCAFLFVRVEDVLCAATLLLREKHGQQYMAGVYDPAYLHLVVNEFLQWEAIRRARDLGLTHYRLGPYFPAVPRGWPIETVSRFKTKFGAEPRTIVQGSLFLKPERYLELAQAHLARLCGDLGE